jgi:hypothetical protein
MDLVAPVSVQTSAAGIQQAVAHSGYAVVQADGVHAWLQGLDFSPLATFWNDLPPDAYLRDGGRYRSRRHGSHVLRM